MLCLAWWLPAVQLVMFFLDEFGDQFRVGAIGFAAAQALLAEGFDEAGVNDKKGCILHPGDFKTEVFSVVTRVLNADSGVLFGAVFFEPSDEILTVIARVGEAMFVMLITVDEVAVQFAFADIDSEKKCWSMLYFHDDILLP